MGNFSNRELIVRKNTYRLRIHDGDFFANRHLKKFIYTQIPLLIQSGMKVGDVGCGGQPFRTLIESYGGQYLGIDVVQNDKNTVDIVADIRSIPLPPESLDVIICTEVLEHVYEPIEALRELYRILKPTGTILLTTPFSYPIHEAPYDFCRLTPFFMEYWLPKLGFEHPKSLQTGGNELEVIATVWGHIWRPDKHAGILLRLLFAAVRSAMNLSVLLTSRLFEPFLRRNYFLNIQCVLRKRTDNCEEPA